jgi:hypothetical protein
MLRACDYFKGAPEPDEISSFPAAEIMGHIWCEVVWGTYFRCFGANRLPVGQ